MHVYDRAYYDYINGGSIRSAEEMLPILRRHFTITSVVDFGAGQCAWLSVWRRMGVSDVLGLDGEYVDTSALLVPPDQFVPADLSRPIRLGRTFDLVQSLEVAEHIAPAAAETFVDNLVAHGSIILFSAAAPGQGGEYHVNEQPYDYWRTLFQRRDYVLLDLIRAELIRRPGVEPWYKYNSFLYVHRDRVAALPGNVQRTQIEGTDPIPDVSPVLYRIRKGMIRFLPVSVASGLAVLKKHYYIRFRVPRTPC